MLQNYLRCIGFSEYGQRRLSSILVRELLRYETKRQQRCKIGEYDYYVETKIEVAQGIGLCICGGYSTYEEETPDIVDLYQYYPFNERNVGEKLALGEVRESVDVFKHYGLYYNEDIQHTVLFLLENNVEYLELKKSLQPIIFKKVWLTGYCLEGRVILDVQKKTTTKRSEAVPSIEFGIDSDKYMDLDANSYLLSDQEKIHFSNKNTFKYNIYQYIESSITPKGVEVGTYFILGTILNVELLENRFSKERFYNLRVEACHLIIHVVIHSKDLDGFLKVGYRFKGEVVLIGRAELEEVWPKVS